MRVVIELKREAVADVVLNQLYRFSPLQTSFGANMVALNGGRPQPMTLLDFLQAFLAFREEVGDFGTLLYAGKDWKDRDLGRRSMVLLAEKVMPKVNAAIGKKAAAE